MGSQVTVTDHDGVLVARDDLHPGGTKARFLRPFMAARPEKEFVYASPCEGGAQTSLCIVARELGRKATIFVAKRAQQHERVFLDRKLKGKVVEVPHGYLNVVQSAARTYAEKRKAYLMPFGFDSEEVVAALAEVAVSVAEAHPDVTDVWCASGSGTLARALGRAFPNARVNAVQVGRGLSREDLPKGARLYVYPRPYGSFARADAPFSSDMNYDAKAWELLTSRKRKGRLLFWNVMGKPSDMMI